MHVKEIREDVTVNISQNSSRSYTVGVQTAKDMVI